jgi:predicted nucleic acid-binding Zn ribbon protein
MSPRRPVRPLPPGDDSADDSADSAALGRRGRPTGMERLGELLPSTARRLGLDEQLELSTAMRAWELLIAEHVPQAVGSCRLTVFSRGVVTVVADQPIVAQELRLRSAELTAALRSALRAPVRELRVLVGHV